MARVDYDELITSGTLSTGEYAAVFEQDIRGFDARREEEAENYRQRRQLVEIFNSLSAELLFMFRRV